MGLNKIEINMVTSNAHASARLYEKMFGIDIVSMSEASGAMSEAKLQKGNMVIQILNENADFGLIAPKEDTISSMWINLIVKGIDAVVNTALKCEATLISPVTEMADARMKNAVIRDVYNHVWVLNEALD